MIVNDKMTYSIIILYYTLNGPLSGTTQVSRYQKGKTSLDFTGARAQTDNHASTPPLSFLQAGCPVKMTYSM